MDESMLTREQTILLVSDDADLCIAARKKLESLEGGIRVSSVGSVDAARRIVAGAAPAVILMEDTSVSAGPEDPREKSPRLGAAVTSLALHAPVVVIGGAGRQTELSALVAAGAADYVERNGACLPVALSLVERRLRQVQQFNESASLPLAQEGAGFGEVLRHELNNPLTGILGNAELLLAEMRRKTDNRMPENGQQRIETIAALAVRLRETIRRLSQEWEARHNALHLH
jgi:signal transduction histidine kinase